MSLPRYIPTRLLEAVVREVKACLSQPELTTTDSDGNELALADLYKSSGVWKIYSFPVMEIDKVRPWQINIVGVPQQFAIGTGGVSDSTLEVEITFHFPVNVMHHTDGGNSWVDHVYALRAWLTSGGTWPNRAASIEDPDNPGNAIGRLTAFEWLSPAKLKDSAAIVIPTIATFEVRENKAGVKL